jgi:hypothetical protein
MVQQNSQSPQQGNVLFPWKLHEMLRDCEQEGNSHIVAWLPDGKAFKVQKASEFVAKILPSYFKQTKYKSFQRQLNLWGFERMTQNGQEKGAYFHKNFLRDQPSLCRFLSRQRAKKATEVTANKIKTRLNPTTVGSSPMKALLSDSSSEDDSFTLSTACTGQKSVNFGFLRIDEMKGEPTLDDIVEHEDQDNFADPLCAPPVCFEGCTFFPLDMERYEELNRQVTKLASDTGSRLTQKDAWDLLQELEQGTGGFSRGSSFVQNAQVCAV